MKKPNTATKYKNEVGLATKYLNKYNSCKDRNIPFELSFAQYKKLLNQKACFYTGTPLVKDIDKPNYVSLDRINNKLGYTKENTVACCTWFNKAKGFVEGNSNLPNKLEALELLGKGLSKITNAWVESEDDIDMSNFS